MYDDLRFLTARIRGRSGGAAGTGANTGTAGIAGAGRPGAGWIMLTALAPNKSLRAFPALNLKVQFTLFQPIANAAPLKRLLSTTYRYLYQAVP